MKVVINTCFGGFGLSKEAYEKLGEWGVPIRKYEAGPASEGEIIFDRDLTPPEADSLSELYWKYRDVQDRYWDCWTNETRTHPLVIRVVEELGSERASGRYAKLKVVTIPDGTNYEISDYDGREHIAEKHETWA